MTAFVFHISERMAMVSGREGGAEADADAEAEAGLVVVEAADIWYFKFMNII
jgi:hypothetical protein